jgi:hypothetical protein
MSLENKIIENTQALLRLTGALENKKLAVDNEQSSSAINNATCEDVQKALVCLSAKYGKGPAKAILAKFDSKKIGDLAERDYSAVINAVDDFFGQEVT